MKNTFGQINRKATLMQGRKWAVTRDSPTPKVLWRWWETSSGYDKLSLGRSPGQKGRVQREESQGCHCIQWNQKQSGDRKDWKNHYNCPELRLVLQLCRSDRDLFNSKDGVFSAGHRKCYHNQNVSGAAPSQWLDSLQFSENYCSRYSARVCINLRKCNSLPSGYDPVGLFLCPDKSPSSMLQWDPFMVF